MLEEPSENETTEVKAQSITVTAGVLAFEGLKAIIAYIIVSLFKPFWEKFMIWAKKKWNKNGKKTQVDQQNSEEKA